MWAVDVAQQMLDLIKGRIAESEPPIELVLSEEVSIPLDDGIADHVFTSTVLHEVPSDGRDEFIAEMTRLLKPGGLLTILDWAPVAERTQGPPNHIRLPRGDVDALLARANADIVRSETFGDNFYIVQGRVD